MFSWSMTSAPGPNFDDVLAYINGHTDDPSTFLQLHFAACVLGLAVIALIGLDIPLLSSIDPVLWSVGVLLAVAASSLYRLLS